MARQYTKKSDYWKKFEKDGQVPTESSDFKPEILGLSLYETEASRQSSGSRQSAIRTNSAATNTVSKRYANIQEGLLPFEYSKDGVDSKEAIVLCQKAYFNIPAFRSTIDAL